MKRIIVILLALVGFVAPLTAQSTDRIYVKDGSVYEGYISTQSPGSSVVVTVQSSTLIVKAENISKLKFSNKAVSELPVQMRNWLKENRPGDESVVLASFVMSGVSYNNVLVIEKGSRYKFLSFDKRTYTLKWGDIIKTCKNEAQYQKTFGIQDVVTLKNGKQFKGTIIEQTIGSELKIKYGKSSIEAIRFADVLSIRSELMNPKANLWKELPLLDKIELRGNSTLIGFISSRIIGQGILLMTQDSAEEKFIDLKDVEVYHKIANSQYVATEEKSTTTKETVEPEKSAEKSAEKPARTSKWEEETKENTTPQSSVEPTVSNVGITINGKIASLNLVQAKDGINYLIYDVVDVVPQGRNIRINLPISMQTEGVKIIKLREYEVNGSTDKILPGWKDTDTNRSGVTATSIDSAGGVDGRWNIEVKSENIDPGIYVLIPLIETSRCVAFRVKP